MKYVLGVDAGNTKTIALVAQLDGTIIGWGRSHCGDIYNAGTVQQAMKHVHEAVTAAVTKASLKKCDIASAAFSMAGADWPEDFALIKSALNKRNYAPRFTVVNDAIGALYAGAEDNWGVAIACGTGAAVSARSLSGEIWHSSFWQEMGGALALGMNALKVVYKSELGILPFTALTEQTLAFYKVTSVEELLHRFTQRQGYHLSNIPFLARTVLSVAAQGDELACEIVRQEGANLADYALVAARKVKIDATKIPLILAGSVFKHQSTLLSAAILNRLQQSLSISSIVRSDLEPSAGAVIIALEQGGEKVLQSIRKRLQQSTPPQEFFVT